MEYSTYPPCLDPLAATGTGLTPARNRCTSPAWQCGHQQRRTSSRGCCWIRSPRKACAISHCRMWRDGSAQEGWSPPRDSPGSPSTAAGSWAARPAGQMSPTAAGTGPRRTDPLAAASRRSWTVICAGESSWSTRSAQDHLQLHTSYSANDVQIVPGPRVDMWINRRTNHCEFDWEFGRRCFEAELSWRMGAASVVIDRTGLQWTDYCLVDLARLIEHILVGGRSPRGRTIVYTGRRAVLYGCRNCGLGNPWHPHRVFPHKRDVHLMDPWHN